MVKYNAQKKTSNGRQNTVQITNMIDQPESQYNPGTKLFVRLVLRLTNVLQNLLRNWIEKVNLQIF